jgi:hypothetical protein
MISAFEMGSCAMIFLSSIMTMRLRHSRTGNINAITSTI